MQQQHFFVMGAPKSGTTWLQIMLDSHPEICCLGEAGLFHLGKCLTTAVRDYNDFLAKKKDLFGEKAFPPVEREEFYKLFRLYAYERLRAHAGKPDARLLGNKDPDYGVFFAPMAETFRDAAFIHIIRDPRDVAVSLWHHNQRYDADNMRGKTFQGFALGYLPNWCQYIVNVRQHARTVKYLEVRYEHLLARPADLLGEMLRFLGAADGPDLIEACLAGSDFQKLSGGRPSGVEDAKAFYRKGVAGDWRNYMDEAAEGEFRRATRGLMEQLGY